MQRRLGDALAVYVDAMRYPRGTEDQRASMWLEHTHRDGWEAVAAAEGSDQPHLHDLLAPGDQRRGQPGMPAVPAARVHRHHPRLPLRRRSARLRDPWPDVATVS